MLVEDPSVLRMTIGPIEAYDESSMKIVKIDEEIVLMRHTLKAVRAWEQITHESFVMTFERSASKEHLDLYIKCMVINNPKNLDMALEYGIVDYKKIVDYINNPMTATTFGKSSKQKPKRRKRKITAEEIYATLTAYNMPIEYLESEWHFNQLNVLIQARSELENPTGKTTMEDKYKLNAQRQARKAKKPHI